MSLKFEDKVFQRISSQLLFDGCEKVLLAVSGGADSVAMAHALCRLRFDGKLHCGVVIGHVNHCLRGGESDADEAFVQELGASFGVDVVTKRGDVPSYAAEHKLSTETAARKVRLTLLAQMAKELDCQCIATAHHADDQAETIIHRLMRGTGFRGLCGIKPVSRVSGGVFVRPMLNIRRSDVIAYCRENCLHWREDASNATLVFTRNRIRHRLLPALQSKQDFTEALGELSQSAQRLQKKLKESLPTVVKNICINQYADGRIVLDQGKLQNCPMLLFYELMRHSLVSLGAGLRHYSQEHIDTIRQMIQQKQARGDFPNNIKITVESGRVTIRNANTIVDLSDLEAVVLTIGEEVTFGPWQIRSRLIKRTDVDLDKFMKTKDSCVEWFDADRIVGKIVMRRRQDGDRFCPIGGQGEKKVGRFLIDAGLDSETKQNAFIITDADKILWIASVRMSEQAKVTRNTHEILEIRVSHSIVDAMKGLK